MIRTLVGVIFCFMLAASSALSHDVWMEKNENQLAIIWGHPGKPEAYDPAKVEMVRAYGLSGQSVPVNIEKKADQAVIIPDKSAAAVSLLFNSGYWTKTADGFKNISKKGIEADIIESFNSVRFSKIFLQWSEQLKKPLDTEIDIVPLQNPFMVKPGDSLSLKVFYQGKPLSGATIYGVGNRENRIKTDKDGLANITIEKSGTQKIGAMHKIQLNNDSNADYLVRTANIIFEVK